MARRTLSHLRDPAVGLIGPVTNRAGNEAQVPVDYRTYEGFASFAQRRGRDHRGLRFEIRVPTMFCAAMTRDVFERVGPLDEDFGLGLFEDDDYAMRVCAAGYGTACAEDVFLHHFGQATIGKLAVSGQYGRLFHENRQRWERKWAMAWEPYGRRPVPEYRRLVEEIRSLACKCLPERATVLVAGKGDDDLTDLDGRRAWHFPGDDGGAYAGHHPADGREAIERLEAQCARGARFLLLTRATLWWLDHYLEFRRHLESRYRVHARRDGVCLIYQLD